MYARDLCRILHDILVSPISYAETEQRFESLRGYRLLPAGRVNADKRLTDDQIASTVLGFVPTLPGWAGHVSLIAGELVPVGGAGPFFARSANLRQALAAVLASDAACSSLVSFTVGVLRKNHGDEYVAKCIFDQNSERKVTSYVSSMALTLLRNGADRDYDHEKLDSSSARQLVLSRRFFESLRKEVVLARLLDFPLRTNWDEYKSEEEKADFHRKLGSQPGSRFLNIAVDTSVAWPREPTLTEFDGHRFVMFPPTKRNSHSISIDLSIERISADDARTLLNRFLSLMSWCDDRHAVLKNGWSGNPVPVPVERASEVFHAASPWLFARAKPEDADLLRRLAYYREGLNARHAGLVTFAVLSFYKVFEKGQRTRRGDLNPTTIWIASAFEEAVRFLSKETIERFDADRGDVAAERYLVENCRVAAAHASSSVPSDADASPEIRRLIYAAEIIHALARYFISTEYGLSKFHFEDS